MRRAGILTMVLLLCFVLPGCSYWTPTPTSALTGPEPPSQARLKTRSGEELHLREIRVEADTMLVGVTRDESREVPISAIVELEVYQVSIARSLAGMVGFAGLIGLVFLIAEGPAFFPS
jgi:hypothetical protein